MALPIMPHETRGMDWPPGTAAIEADRDSQRIGTLQTRLQTAITASIMPTYVYTYPPRQSYYPLPEYRDTAQLATLLTQTPENFNLYLHFPFCTQICHFCNLYTVAGHESLIDDYIETLAVEMQHYWHHIGPQQLRTVYLGGGTPSLLDARQLERVFTLIERYFPNFRTGCDEICIEAAPDTITPEKAAAFQAVGINRVNLGVQTFNARELRQLGRTYTSETGIAAVRLLKAAGIANICVDLINGLLGQTEADWLTSLDILLDLQPETFCIYPLTVRPATGYHKNRDVLANNPKMYHQYDLALAKLLAKGYVQETHIRYIIPGKGGYKQKEYHWEGATVLGCGAGARTYAPSIHFRNGYSARQRQRVLQNYFDNVATTGHGRVDGYVISPDEEIRREFTLNLHRINQTTFARQYHRLFTACFQNEIQALLLEGFIMLQGDTIVFTAKGYKYRDLIARLFFSEEVMAREAQYLYND